VNVRRRGGKYTNAVRLTLVNVMVVVVDSAVDAECRYKVPYARCTMMAKLVLI
jgi:hypothetical protein